MKTEKKKKRTPKNSSNRTLSDRFGFKRKMVRSKWERHDGFSRAIRAWSGVWGTLMDYDEQLFDTGMEVLIEVLESVEKKGYWAEEYVQMEPKDFDIWGDFDQFDIDWTFGAKRPPKSVKV